MAVERSRVGMLSLQRARLLSAAVGLLAEEGYGSFSAAGVCSRAGVSRRTFYEIFEDREACLVGVLADAEARVEGLLAGSVSSGLSWRERIRSGLWAILCLADSDPALARVCLVESQRAGALVQRERERIARRLIEAIDDGRGQSARTSTASELTAEALVGAASAVIATRLVASPEAVANTRKRMRGDGAGVHALLGELMAMIVLPYLGAGAARREIERALPEALEVSSVGAGGADPLARLPVRLTYRTARVLIAAAELEEGEAGASNRQIGDQAGVSDPGQISKLLARLQRIGLLENAALGLTGRGEANSWRLTSTGRRLVRSITVQVADAPLRQRSAA